MKCENIDGQCGSAWCDCDYQKRKRANGLSSAAGSAPKSPNGTYRYELFKVMLDEHGLLLSSDELDQIANAAMGSQNTEN